MRDATRDACVRCVRRMRRIREVFAQIVTHASFYDAGASYQVSVTHASGFRRSDLIGEALLSTKKVPRSSTGVVGTAIESGELMDQRGQSPVTRVKQEHFEVVLRQQFSVTLAAIASARKKYPNWNVSGTFHYIDLNGGPGLWVDRDWEPVAGRPLLIEGSPVIALRVALERGIPFYETIFESDPAACVSLRAALVGTVREFAQSKCDPACCPGCCFCDDDLAVEAVDAMVEIIQGDHNVTVPRWIESNMPQIKGAAYGLIYADPFGKIDFPLRPLIALTSEKKLQRLEVLVNVAALAYKRPRMAGQSALRNGRETRMTSHAESYLIDDLAKIPKQHCWVRKPVGKWAWTMFLLTNWIDYKGSTKVGFVDSQSLAGQELLLELDLSSSERRAQEQAQLPLGESRPIGPTPSTSGIRSSSPSVPSSSSVAAASANGATPLAQPSPIT